MSAVTLPAPLGGWNAKDAYSAMPATDAARLVNWIPRAGFVQTRGGFVEHCTGLGGDVATLASYRGASDVMIAGCSGELWDVSTGTAVSLASGFTSDWWQVANHSRKLVFVNGEDAPQVFDGTTMAAANFTGSPGDFVPADMWGINSHKGRMFYWAKGEQSCWYATAGALQGVMAEFDMSSLLLSGGSLVMMVTWTLDSGSGVDDLAVFIFSTGETLVYSGSDPGDVNDWSLIGRFQIGEPLGPRAHCKVAATEIILTSDGYVDISKALQDGRYSENSAYSAKIIRASKDAAAQYKQFNGWEAVLYPGGQLFIVNVPVGLTASHQHVRETSSGGWCEFNDMNALTFCVHNGLLYFGDAQGRVCQADAGSTDAGAAIFSWAIPAYSYLGSKTSKKQLTAVSITSSSLRPQHFIYDGLADFAQLLQGQLIEDISSGDSLWDIAEWDVSEWGVSKYNQTRVTSGWKNCAAVGFAISVSVRVKQGAQTINWHSTAFQYRKAGVF